MYIYIYIYIYIHICSGIRDNLIVNFNLLKGKLCLDELHSDLNQVFL